MICEHRFSQLFLPFSDICKSQALPSEVEKRLQLEWPFQELLLLQEQYQKKFKTTTYSSKKCLEAWGCLAPKHIDLFVFLFYGHTWQCSGLVFRGYS